ERMNVENNACRRLVVKAAQGRCWLCEVEERFAQLNAGKYLTSYPRGQEYPCHPRLLGRQRSNLRSILRRIHVITRPAAAMMMMPTMTVSVWNRAPATEMR